MAAPITNLKVQPAQRPVSITLQTLLEAGAHFGTPTGNWNPKMKPYIYGIRNDVYILNLEKTIGMWDEAANFIVELTSRGQDILFVGTKDQTKSILKDEALASGAHFVNEKWLGGTLTNLKVIRASITHLESLEKRIDLAEKGEISLSKKEILSLTKRTDKLVSRLGGLRNMKKLPAAVFVFDAVKEHNAVAEAMRAQIPVIALVDADANPEEIAFPIPANDDGTASVTLFIRAAADAVKEGKMVREASIQVNEDLKVSNQLEKEATQVISEVKATVKRKPGHRTVEITSPS